MTETGVTRPFRGEGGKGREPKAVQPSISPPSPAMSLSFSPNRVRVKAIISPGFRRETHRLQPQHTKSSEVKCEPSLANAEGVLQKAPNGWQLNKFKHIRIRAVLFGEWDPLKIDVVSPPRCPLQTKRGRPSKKKTEFSTRHHMTKTPGGSCSTPSSAGFPLAFSLTSDPPVFGRRTKASERGRWTYGHGLAQTPRFNPNRYNRFENGWCTQNGIPKRF